MAKQIPLTQGKCALVDDSDYEELAQYKWYTFRNTDNLFYAARKVGGKVVFMHNHFLGLGVDHKNHDGLNNTRSNLRKATNRENMFNKRPYRNCVSAYKGVRWRADRRTWIAAIKRDGINYHLGTFSKEEEAARAYDKAASSFFGEFANLNFKS